MQTRQTGPLIRKAGNYNEELLEMDANASFCFMEEGYADAKISKPQIFLSVDKRSLRIEIQSKKVFNIRKYQITR